MSMKLRTITILAMLAAAAAGLVAVEDQDDPLAGNGEMPRPTETEQAWAAQVGDAEAEDGAAPVITGFMMWRGRADRDYKPFHQWEIRIRGGEETVRGLAFRIIPIGIDLEPFRNQEGHWVEVGRLGADDSVDTSYKLNCTHPAAARVEMRWEGGEASYFATANAGLPTREDPDNAGPKVIALPPEYQYLPRSARAGVKYRLLNRGSAEASGVVQVLHFRDQNGAVVHTHEYVPNEGVLPAGYDEEQQIIVERVPPFDTVAITTRVADAGGFDPGEFSERAEVEVAHLTLADGQLSADVRNGLDEAVLGLVVTIALLDDGGATLEEVEIAVGELAAGAEQAIEAPLSEGFDAGAVGGWSAGFAYGGGGDSGAAAGPAAMAPIDVEGVVLTVRDIAASGDGYAVAVTIANQRDGDLAGLTCELTFADAAGEQLVIPMAIGDLAAGASLDATVDVAGLADIAGVSLNWNAGG